MKKIVFLILLTIPLSMMLSSCILVNMGQNAPVRLVWHINDPSISDARFAYDSNTNILFIRGDDAATATIMAVNFMDKKILWKRIYPIGVAVTTNIKVYDGKVYLLEDRILSPKTIPGLVALDEKTGKQIWKLPFKKVGVYNGFTLYNGYIYTFGGGYYQSTYIYKVDAESEKVIWKVPIEGAFDTNPIIDKEYGYVDFGTSIDPDDGKDPRYFYAIDINTGKVI